MKKILSFFLVLCMLITAVPALLMPVLAEGAEGGDAADNKIFSFAEEFVADLSYNVSEVDRNSPIGGTPFATDEEYVAWLKSEGVFAIDQGESNWKVGEYNLTTGTLDLFARLACNPSTAKHDFVWAVTESVYQMLIDDYAVQTGTKGNLMIANGVAMWHLNASAAADSTQSLTPGGLTALGAGNHLSAIQYTVAENGNYGISFEELRFAASYTEHRMAILVNNELVWPVAATANDIDSWFALNSIHTTLEELVAETAALSFEASAGDTVTFCVTGVVSNAVFINPVMVQKTGDAVYLTLSDVYGPNTQAIETRPGATVTLPKYEGDLIFFGWDADGDGIVDIADEGQYTIGEKGAILTAVVVKPSRYYDNRPVWDEVKGSVRYSGGWTAGIWEKATMTFIPYSLHKGTFLVTSNSGPWNGSGGGFYDITNRACCTIICGCVDAEILAGTDYARTAEEISTYGSYIQSIQKTADYSGTVQLDLDKFVISRVGNAAEACDGPIAGGVAIYVNGEKVWPRDTENEYFHFITEKTYNKNNTVELDFKADMISAGTWPFPVTFDVETGDVIDIRCVSGKPDMRFLYTQPTVTYTALEETPTVSHTSVDIAKDFTLNVYANILEKNEDSTAHLEYWTAEPTAAQLAAGGTELALTAEENGLYKFAYTGLTAKQMTDEIYVRPYTTNEAGEKNYGTVVPVSIKAYAMAAMGRSKALDNLLVAMLNYGANAQVLFGYKAEDVANAGLTKDQKNATADTSALTDVYANADGANKIKSVSLIMDTDIGMKYMIDSVEGATTYELEVSKDASFSGSTKIAMKAAWEGKEQKAIHHISLAEMGDTFYVRAVVDGVAGATLTYSVESYVLRVSEDCDDDLYFTIQALAYLDQMIEAYTA